MPAQCEKMEINDKIILIDAHCDFLTAREDDNRELSKRNSTGHVDLPRLKQGGVNVQFFAAYISPFFKSRALERAIELIDVFFIELEKNKNDLALVKCFPDLKDALRNRKIAAILAIEGGEALAGSLGVLRILYLLGVRCLTLTWNFRNEIADGVFDERSKGGLTSFGAEVIQEMNRLNMLIDVSHLSEAGFWDVLEISRKPVIASHSNCRKICDNPRNLSDHQIRSLARAGGVMGLCFVPDFVYIGKPSLDKLIDHVDHAVEIAGIDCIGLGSDFDGFETEFPGLEDVSRLPVLTEGLLKRGYSVESVQKILGGNFLRVLSEL